MKIALIEAAGERVIGFNGSAKPLGERSQADLADLLIIAHESGRQDYLDLFDNPPKLAELKKARTDAKLEGAQVPRPAALAAHPGQLPANVPAKPFGPENQDQVNTGSTDNTGDTGATVTAAPAATGSAGSTAGAGAGTTSSSVAQVFGLAGHRADLASINQ